MRLHSRLAILASLATAVETMGASIVEHIRPQRYRGQPIRYRNDPWASKNPNLPSKGTGGRKSRALKESLVKAKAGRKANVARMRREKKKSKAR